MTEEFELLLYASAARHRTAGLPARDWTPLQSPFEGVVVGSGGRWFDLASLEKAFPKALMSEPAAGVLPSPGLNESLRISVSDLLSVADTPSAPSLILGTELSALDRRLSRIEALLSKTIAADREAASRKTGGSKEVKGRGRSDPEIREKPEVKPALVNLASIASAVDAHAMGDSPLRREVLDTYPGAKIFAVDADARSFEVREHGDFDGRAAILISIPAKMRSGQETEISISVPAVVRGKLSPDGEIKIAEVSLNS